MPSLTGEKDILRIYQLMPGIQSGREGSSSLHVRGGSPDQNLILIDDVPVYYINHLGGFVSIFDENAINKLKVIKGGFPARYGGRLSSIVDVRLKDGNMQKYSGEFSLGLIASKFSFQGPLIKNKTSFIISARRCNLDLITKPITYFSEGVSAGYTFYDLNLKIRHKINQNNNIYFTTYIGNDNIKVNFNDTESNNSNSYSKSQMKNQWGNINTAFRWNHIYTNKLFSNFTLAFSKFYYKTYSDYQEIEDNKRIEQFLHSYEISIQDLIAKIDYDYYLSPSNHFKFGGYYTFKNYNPGKEKYIIYSDSTFNYDIENTQTQLFSHEFACYIEDKITIKNILFLNIGVHASGYNTDNNFFYSIQPRIIPKIKIYKDLYFTTSFTKMKQYIHLLSNSGTGMPNDLWMPATKIAKPENAMQISAGFSNYFNKINIYFSVEAYYKKLDNLIEQNNTLSVTDIEKTWEDRIFTNGNSEIYGIEVLLRKSFGKFSGWVAYTWSKNYRWFDEINNGNKYPYAYDRRHDFSIVINYKLSKKITFSGTWVYASGTPITLGISKINLIEYDKGGSSHLPNYPVTNFRDISIYGTINNYRMPNYHRLDLAINSTKQKKRGTRTVSFSIYNVYNRKNAYFLYFGKDENDRSRTRLYKFTLFPIIPSISYSFKF